MGKELSFRIYLRRLNIWLWLTITLILLSAFTERRVEAHYPNHNANPTSYIAGQPLGLSFLFGSHIHLDPSQATPNDVIRITVGGEWFNVCVPRYHSHQIIGNVIRITASANLFDVCVALVEPTSWSFTVEIGPLPIGLYTVEVYLLDLSLPGSPPILYDTISFMVATERVYLPVILCND